MNCPAMEMITGSFSPQLQNRNIIGRNSKSRTIEKPKNNATFSAQMKCCTTILFILALAGCSSDPLEIQIVDPEDIVSQASKHKGTDAVLINFWATWCKPCVDEFPDIVALDEQYRHTGFKTYFVSLDFFDDASALIEFLENHGVEGVTFKANDSDPNTFINAMHPNWSGAIPFTIVYGKKSGKVVDYWEGQRDKAFFEHAIIKALNS